MFLGRRLLFRLALARLGMRCAFIMSMCVLSDPIAVRPAMSYTTAMRVWSAWRQHDKVTFDGVEEEGGER